MIVDAKQVNYHSGITAHRRELKRTMPRARVGVPPALFVNRESCEKTSDIMDIVKASLRVYRKLKIARQLHGMSAMRINKPSRPHSLYLV